MAPTQTRKLQAVVEAFEERFSGYREDAAAELARTFEDVSGYHDMILLRDVRLESHCEHHIAPFTGIAHVAYLPDKRVVGLSKLARVVDIFARRLQVQESLTAQIGGRSCRAARASFDRPTTRLSADRRCARCL